MIKKVDVSLWIADLFSEMPDIETLFPQIVEVKSFFPEIPDGVKVRPQFSSEDLRLIRDGLMVLMWMRGERGTGSNCVQLIRRILRRV